MSNHKHFKKDVAPVGNPLLRWAHAHDAILRRMLLQLETLFWDERMHTMPFSCNRYVVSIPTSSSVVLPQQSCVLWCYPFVCRGLLSELQLFLSSEASFSHTSRSVTSVSAVPFRTIFYFNLGLNFYIGQIASTKGCRFIYVFERTRKRLIK
jgi:hypothetical protein